MTSQTDELRLIKETFVKRTRDRFSELNLTASDVAELIGSPKSTISEILNLKNARLPSLYLLIRLARVLGVQPVALLPAHYLSFDPDLQTDTSRFVPPQAVDFEGVLALTLRYGMQSRLFYHPRNLPDFVKTPDILSREMGIDLGAATIYLDRIQQILGSKMQGVMALDQQSLIDLIDRKGLFQDTSRSDSLAALDRLKTFSDGSNGDAKIIVCDRSVQKIDPILILNETTSLAFFFGSFLFITDPTLVQAATRTFERLEHTAPELNQWLSSV